MKIDGMIISAGSLYGCEKWSLTQTRCVLKKTLLKIFGAKRYNISGKWRRSYNSELRALNGSDSSVIMFRRLQ